MGASHSIVSASGQCTHFPMVYPTRMRMQWEGLESRCTFEIMCILLIVVIALVRMITKLLVAQNWTLEKQDISAGNSPQLCQQPTQKRRSSQSRKKKNKHTGVFQDISEPDGTTHATYDEYVQDVRQAPLTAMVKNANMVGSEQKDAPVVAASIEPRMLSNDLKLTPSSPSVTTDTVPEFEVSCLVGGEHVESVKPEIPCLETWGGEDRECDHNKYSRSLLLGHHVVSLRIAKGPPGLENQPEVVRLATAAAQLMQPLVVKAMASSRNPSAVFRR